MRLVPAPHAGELVTYQLRTDGEYRWRQSRMPRRVAAEVLRRIKPDVDRTYATVCDGSREVRFLLRDLQEVQDGDTSR